MRFLLPLLFILATYGFCTFAVDVLKLRGSFALPFVFVWYALIVFFAGLVGLLFSAVIVLCVVGTGLFIYYCIQKSKRKLLWFDPVWLGLFLLLSAFAIYHLRGQKLTHYDNFSHWANIVQVMLENGRFPISTDSIISFTSYPPGSASFLYLIGTIFGNSEDILLIGQAILLIAAILALYRKTNLPKVVLPVLLVSFGVFSFFFNTTIYDLLVDSLLPLYGAFAIILLYESIDGPRRILMFVIPVLCFTFLIKNSGLYFVAIAVVAYSASLGKTYGHLHLQKKLYVWIGAALLLLVIVAGIAVLLFAKHLGYSSAEIMDQLKSRLPLLAALLLAFALALYGAYAIFLMPRAPRKQRITLFALIVIPAVLFAIWMIHVRLVFHTTASKHAMSISNFLPMLMHKSIADMLKIALAYVKALLSAKSIFWCALVLIGGGLSYVLKKRLRPAGKGQLRLILFSFIGYLFFLYIMYVVSMPKAEAFIVSEFDRYFKTIVFFSVFIALYGISNLPAVSETPARSARVFHIVSYLAAAVIAVCLFVSVGDRAFTRQDYTASERYYLETLIDHYDIDNDQSYLIIVPAENDFYMQYLGMYTFRTNRVTSIAMSEFDTVKDWAGYRYIICIHLSDSQKAQVVSMLGEATITEPIPDVIIQN